MTSREFKKLAATLPDTDDTVVYCGPDCIIRPIESLSIAEESYIDEEGYSYEAGTIVLD